MKSFLKIISPFSINKENKFVTFKEQLNLFKSGKLTTGVKLIITPKLKGLEFAGINKKPLVIKQSDIRKILNEKHGKVISEIFLINIEKELNHSVLALDSITHNNSKIIVLNKYDENNNPIIAIIQENKEVNSIKVNNLCSIYEKRDFQKFIERTIEANKKIYCNKKTDKWLSSNRLQLPTADTHSPVHEDILPLSNQNVKQQVIKKDF